ncbi:ABC transporter ATP-binding protein/permease (plasmid) [Rhizobium sp. NIBRBAC000502774]|nr:ABC transporter ATP-binding protein/permease [Rhizobium sp. NIBRBAC000502774]
METFRAFLRIAAPYWGSYVRWREWLILAAAIGCSLAFIRVTVAINTWHKEFYDALAAFDGAIMPALLLRYLGYLALIVGFIAAGNWLGKVVVFRWRESLTHYFQRAWLDEHRHYRHQLDGEPDNPDQRIAEDLRRLADESMYLFKYFVMNLARLGAFVAILWELSGVQAFYLGGVEITVNGYLVWIAMAYSIISTGLIHLIGNKLHGLNIDQQRREADYRACLLRVRDHSEQIALYGGEHSEDRRLSDRFALIKRNWFALIGREFRVECFSAAQMRIAWFIPIAAILPRYLDRSIGLGEMMQAQSAFSNVLDGFGWFLNYYKRIMEWSAVVRRIAQFKQALNELQRKQSDFCKAGGEWPHLRIHHLDVFDTSGRPLIEGVTIDVSSPCWLLVDGPSGIGKSTFLRVLANLWPYYSGDFCIRGKALFLPQETYLPTDTLRRALCYPSTTCRDDEEIADTLAVVGMGHLASSLDREEEWSKILSGGERQRLAVVQALLFQPDILFLDEITSQIDPSAAIGLVRILKEKLPNALVVGVAHQPEVKAEFEDTILRNSNFRDKTNDVFSCMG